MAAGALTHDELCELVRELTDVVSEWRESALINFEEDVIEVPIGEALNRELTERDALAATLKTLPEQTRAELRAVFAQEMGREVRLETVPVTVDDGRYSLERAALKRHDEVMELLRRAALRDQVLRDALAGCEALS